MDQPNNNPYEQSPVLLRYDAVDISSANLEDAQLLSSLASFRLTAPLPDFTQLIPLSSPGVAVHDQLQSEDKGYSSTSTPINTRMASESTNIFEAPTQNPDAIDEKTSAELELFSRLTLNDSNISPKPFEGKQGDSERAEQWVNAFKAYAKLRSLTKASQAQYFALLMVKDAAIWLQSLPEEITTNIDSLIAEFNKRFSLTALDRWRKASTLWSREQAQDESVDKYISDIRNSARIVPITDQAMLQFAIIRGLRPEIKLHVLQSSPKSIEDVLSSARVAEIATAASQPTSEVTLLRRQVATLIEKLDSKPTVAAVTQPEPSRRVTFSSPRRDEPEQRPMSPWSDRSPSMERRRDNSSYSRRSASAEPRQRQFNDQRPSYGDDYRSYEQRPNYSRDNGQRQFNDRYFSRPLNSGRSNWQSNLDRQPRRQQEDQRPPNRLYTGNARFRNNDPRFASLTCFKCNRLGHIARFCEFNDVYSSPMQSYRP
jgi:hypothetical protein